MKVEPGISIASGLRSGLISADHEHSGRDVLAAAPLHGVVHEPWEETKASKKRKHFVNYLKTNFKRFNKLKELQFTKFTNCLLNIFITNNMFYGLMLYLKYILYTLKTKCIFINISFMLLTIRIILCSLNNMMARNRDPFLIL